MNQKAYSKRKNRARGNTIDQRGKEKKIKLKKEMREEMDGYVKIPRFFLVAMACFIWIGLLLSLAAEGGGRAPSPPLAPVMSGEGQGSNGRITMELFHVSKRRVPNGPDPIHNRRAGNSGRSPRGA